MKMIAAVIAAVVLGGCGGSATPTSDGPARTLKEAQAEARVKCAEFGGVLRLDHESETAGYIAVCKDSTLFPV